MLRLGKGKKPGFRLFGEYKERKLEGHRVKFRKKPVVIEAWQFTKENFKNGAPEFVRHSDITLWSQYGGKVIGGEIATLEGNMIISENDYIIQTENGEFYPCKPDILKRLTRQLMNRERKNYNHRRNRP